ncbi:hypothetical protein FACS189468_5890 [Spirochaetia bacterium]|nr:hypothetical protein FACS189468_5890 [Spirochaetia bacterium]
MNAWKNITFCICIICFDLWLLPGCRTARGLGSESIVEHSIELGVSQEQNRAIERYNKQIAERLDSITDGLEQLRTNNSGATSDIDQAIADYKEYQRRTRQLIADYRRLAESIKNGDYLDHSTGVDLPAGNPAANSGSDTLGKGN